MFTLTSMSRIQFFRKLNEEDGLSTYLTGLMLAVGLLALLFIFIPFMSLYTTRRVAQNGADAAALAAVGYYEEKASVFYPEHEPFSGECNEPLQSVHYRAVREYRQDHYRRMIGRYFQAAQGEAARFAEQNHTQLVLGQYSAQISGAPSSFKYRHNYTGIVFDPTLVRARTVRNFVLRQGGNQDVPANASALLYLDRMEVDEEREVIRSEECTIWEVRYRYWWKVTLSGY